MCRLSTIVNQHFLTLKKHIMSFFVSSNNSWHDSNFKLTLQQVFFSKLIRRFDLLLQILIAHWLSGTWPRYFYRSWSRIGCLGLDPDTSTDLDCALVVWDLTQILLQILIMHWLSGTWPRYRRYMNNIFPNSCTLGRLYNGLLADPYNYN